MFQDLRYGARMLLKHKGFTTVAVLTLALGIGANTAIFGIFSGVLLRPLPFPEAQQLVVSQGRPRPWMPVVYFAAWQAGQQSLVQMAAYNPREYHLTMPTETELIEGAEITPDFFPTLGVAPQVGRNLLAEEAQPGRGRVAVVSAGLWLRQFGNAQLDNQTLRLNGEEYQVVGVLPDSFQPFELNLRKPDDDAHAGAIEAIQKAAGKYQIIYSESTAQRTDVEGMRRHAWSVAMAGLMPMLLGMDIANTPVEALQQCRSLQKFFEATNFWTMASHDELKHDGTKYVLADPGRSYIAYADGPASKLGIRGLPAGRYAVTWLDCRTGATASGEAQVDQPGDHAFEKPRQIGTECAAWIRRADFIGTDQFTWKVNDDKADSKAATVTITVSAKKAGTPVGQTQIYFPPPDAEGGWRTLKDAEEIRRVAGMDKKKLDEAFEFIKGSTKHGGLVVLRKGWLVYENYFGLGHREATPNLASCGKSFTSIAVGMLMAERRDLFPDGLDQKVFTPRYFPAEAFPLSDPRKQDIKLGQLLAFTAGIRGNNPSYVNGKATTIDPVGPDGWQAKVEAIAHGKRDGVFDNKTPFSAATLWRNPGEGYSYASSSIHLASIMLRHVTGMELQEFVDQRLAKPLGWGRWGYGYKNHPEVAHTPGSGGIALRATDMLRFGYLLLNEGRWRDKQLVPAEYVRHCARQSPYNPHFPYSLQFDVNTEGGIPELPRDAFWKGGSGGHVLYVVPSLDLVVWKLGGRDEQYSPNNTGLPPSPASKEQVAARRDWKETVDRETAVRRTLKMVIDAMTAK